MSANNAIEIDRRRFLATCATACGAAMVSGGCASLASHPVTTVNGRVRLALSDHPQLARPQGVVRILPTGERDPIFVLALGDDRFNVLSSVCTHRGCTVDAQDAHLVCPCHGSTYDRTGAVLRGPAERPLRRYETRVADGHLEITL